MAGKGITVDEWLGELQRLSAKNDEGMTTPELARHLGLSERTMVVRLRQAKEMGWLVVGRALRESINGQMRPVSVYRIVKPRK